MKPAVIGLTGPTGAGKSLLAGLFADGYLHIESDRVAREVVRPESEGLRRLTGAFGTEILLPDGSLNRAALAARAFASESGNRLLNSITHPLILEKINDRIARSTKQGTPVLLDAPLLFESGADRMCDRTVAVLAPESVRLDRIMRRDRIDSEQALLRIRAQKPDEYYESRADYTIRNDGALQAFERRAWELRRLLEQD